MAVSEFGVPKVIGGNYPVLAIDIYKQVIGQQNFQLGAVVGLVLLVPAVVAFAVDHAMQRRQQALLTARSVPYSARRSPLRDALLLGYVVIVSLWMIAVVGMAVFGSFVKFWPYNLSLTLNHYTFGFADAGVEHAYWNSLVMAGWCAVLGAAVTFAGAYWLEKTRGADLLRPAIRLQAMLPMAVPGMVLGIGYILFFNNPANPLHGLYGTMAILVLSTIVHFYSSSHLTAVTALKQLDGEFESVSASLKVPVLQDVLAGHRAGLPADGHRHRPLLLRQRDDDDLGGRLPVFAQDHARGDLDPATGRGRGDRVGRGDGDADSRHLGDGHRRLVRHRGLAAAADAGLASHGAGVTRRPTARSKP